MATIQLTTTVDITFDMWVAQAKRFAKIEDKVNENNTPLDDSTSGAAIIEVTYNNPLMDGFNGRIVYYQKYDRDVEQQDLDPITGDAVGVAYMVSRTFKKKIIDYNQNFDRATMDYLIDQAMVSVPDAVTSTLDRLEHAITSIILGQVVDHFTFDLAADKWTTL